MGELSHGYLCESRSGGGCTCGAAERNAGLPNPTPPRQGAAADTLRERCRAIATRLHQDAMLRQGNSVDTLMEFVIAETGRKADERLAESLPLCLYFADEQDREEFIALVREAKPGMIMRKMP